MGIQLKDSSGNIFLYPNVKSSDIEWLKNIYIKNGLAVTAERSDGITHYNSFINAGYIDVKSDTHTEARKEILKAICQKYKDEQNCIIVGQYFVGGFWFFIGSIYDTNSLLSDGLPTYSDFLDLPCFFHSFTTNLSLVQFGTDGKNGYGEKGSL